jgi:hypothetical protein
MIPVGITTAVESPGSGIGNTSGIVNIINEAGSDRGPSSLTISSIVRASRDLSSSNRLRISDVRGVARSLVLAFDRGVARFCLAVALDLTRARLLASGRSKSKPAPSGAAMLAVMAVL